MNAGADIRVRAEPDSNKAGRWIALGAIPVVVAVGMVMLQDSGSTEFWPGAIVVAAFVTAISMAFVLPGYLAYAGITVFILDRTRLSAAARKRWIIGPPLLFLAIVLLKLVSDLRPNVAIRKAIGDGAPKKSVSSTTPTCLYSCRADTSHGLMLNRLNFMH